MSQELQGLSFLKKNEIKNKTYDPNKPFAFISYSHDDYDTQIVRNVFDGLYSKHYNLWIDTANIPYDERSWGEAAMAALRNPNCKTAIFFRSESSLVKGTILEELDTIKRIRWINRIITVDIWHDKDMNAIEFKNELLNSQYEGGSDRYSICRKIYQIVEEDCSALRLASDLDNDISKLIEELEGELVRDGVTNNGVKTRDVLGWEAFDRVKAFSYAGLTYNVDDSEHAYVSIINEIKKKNSMLCTEEIIPGAIKRYTYLPDFPDAKLNLPKTGFNIYLERIPEFQPSEIELYEKPIEEAYKAKPYEVVTTAPYSFDRFSDPLIEFQKNLKKLTDHLKQSWKKAGYSEKTPSVVFEKIQVVFEHDMLKHHRIQEKKWKPIFTDIMNFFYEISGSRYYEYAVLLCQNGNKEPAIINQEQYQNLPIEHTHYAAIGNGKYWFRNWNSAVNVVGDIISHVNRYFKYLKDEEGIEIPISAVVVQYSLPEDIKKIMNEIHQNETSIHSHVVAADENRRCECETLEEFEKHFKQALEALRDDWKRTHSEKTPAIIFEEIKLCFPDTVLEGGELTANKWKVLFQKMMEAFYQRSGSQYFQYITEKEKGKGRKEPSILDRLSYESMKLERSHYTSIGEGEYWFKNWNSAIGVIGDIKAHIHQYFMYLAQYEKIAVSVSEVKIYYCVQHTFRSYFE